MTAFDELFQTFQKCREPDLGRLRRSSSARRDLQLSSSITGGFTAQHAVAVHRR